MLIGNGSFNEELLRTDQQQQRIVSRETAWIPEGSIVQDSAIFQRTESGRNEIRNKLNGLTQSERLVLIVVDGVAPYAEMRKKLKGLVAERFDRALNNLLRKQLIFEVLLPAGTVDEEVYDSATVDRFLQQDPLDPVTIISFDPEDEVGLDDAQLAPEAPAQTGFGQVLVQSQYASVDSRQAVAAPVAAPARLSHVDFYIPLELTRRDVAAKVPSTSGTRKRASTSSHRSDAHHGAGEFSASVGKVAWGQVIIAAGILLIVISIFVRMMH